MKSSTTKTRLAILAAGFVDLTARLLVPGSLLALARGQAGLAAVLAATVNALAVGRGLMSGWLLERMTVERYRDLVDASQRHPVAALRARGPEHSVAMLIGATHRIASVEAMTIPRILSDMTGLVLVGAATTYVVPSSWLAAGVVGLVLVGALVLLIQRHQRRVEQDQYDRTAEIIVGLEALLDGCVDLRAHDRHGVAGDQLREAAAAMARAKGRSALAGALLGLVPVGLVLLAATPGAGWLRARVGAVPFVEAGALAATMVALALSLARATEDLVRSAPERRAFRDYLAGDSRPLREEASARAAGWLRDATIVFDGLSVSYDGSGATPYEVRHRWTPGRGLAILGHNGAGKSTLALALLGLVEPSSGAILVDGEPLEPGALRPRVAYLPQSPFTAPGQTVRWHLELLAGDGYDDADAERALAESGIGGLRGGVLDLPAGSLSGGERRRMHLARLLLPHGGAAPELVILDEPEAGLDAGGRDELRALAERLARTARVLLIAHDPSVIPESFEQLFVKREHAIARAA